MSNRSVGFYYPALAQTSSEWALPKSALKLWDRSAHAREEIHRYGCRAEEIHRMVPNLDPRAQKEAAKTLAREMRTAGRLSRFLEAQDSHGVQDPRKSPAFAKFLHRLGVLAADEWKVNLERISDPALRERLESRYSDIYVDAGELFRSSPEPDKVRELKKLASGLKGEVEEFKKVIRSESRKLGYPLDDLFFGSPRRSPSQN